MISVRKATIEDLEAVMSIRLEMLKIVNNLPKETVFNKEFVDKTREYFISGQQSTVLAVANENSRQQKNMFQLANRVWESEVNSGEEIIIGCATICYMNLMPTVDHPKGKRAHIMNVYTKSRYRRQGIGLKMMNMLIDEAIREGVTEISLDATESGRLLYKKCGFVANREGMVLNLTDRV